MRCKITILWLLGILILATTSWPIINGDFELGNLSGWLINGNINAYANYLNGHSGSYCCKLAINGDGQSGGVSQTETASHVGETWSVDAWIYVTKSTCKFGWFDGSPILISNKAWTHYSDMRTFRSAMEMDVDLYYSADPPGAAFLDGVQTQKISDHVNAFGSFDIMGDLSYWSFEKYGDGTGLGSIAWVDCFGGQSGVAQISQYPGEKGKITQVFSVPSSGWYTARVKVATDIVDKAQQQKVYLYLAELSSNFAIISDANIVIQPGKGGLSTVSTWRELKISFYSSTNLMSVQLVSINPGDSGTYGSLYVDDIWVTPGVAEPIGTITIKNPSFDTDTSGWTLQVYADGTSPGIWTWLSNLNARSGVLLGFQSGGEKGKLSQPVNLFYTQQDAVCSVWVYSGAASSSLTQKIYLYIYSYSNSGYSYIVESGNAILQPGNWPAGVWRKLQFAYAPYTSYNSVQLVGINPAGRSAQSIYFDGVEIKQGY
ncbi:MAG: hypothetical protein ACE14V_10570 [bacterium]